jgi:hypothetical protein
MAGRIFYGKRKGALLMIHEFALDPAVATDWSSFKYIVDQCGVQHGRLISRFPRKWDKDAYAACQNIQGDRERKKYVEKIISIKNDKKLASFHRDYNDKKDWLQNAVNQHAARPFRAIISPQSPKGNESVLFPEEIDENNALWNVPTQAIVPRRSYDLACCAATLLSISSEILFVDPNFDPLKPRFLSTLSHMIAFAFAFKEPRQLEMHAEFIQRREDKRGTDWKEDCERCLPAIIPVGSTMQILRWESKQAGDKPHARYVLTERGGIHYDYGLDEWEGDGQTTDVSLLREPQREQRWRDYHKETAAYTLIIDFPVFGIKDIPQSGSHSSTVRI